MGSNQSNETLMCIEPRDDGVYYFARFDEKPFDQGTCRHAYKGQLICNREDINRARYNGSSVVVKVFIKGRAKDYGAWNADISASRKANEYAALFNQNNFTERSLYFPIPFVAKMDKRAGHRMLGLIRRETDMRTNPVSSTEYVAMEELLSGTFIKFNSNGGYVNDDVNSSTMPAFSHWTFHHSNGQLLVCDLQGVFNNGNYRLTDPAIHSQVQNKYGVTDLGVLGQAMFFNGHTCNNICRHWKKLKLTSELCEELQKVNPSMGTMFTFELPRHIKTDQNQFRNLTIIQE